MTVHPNPTGVFPGELIAGGGEGRQFGQPTSAK